MDIIDALVRNGWLKTPRIIEAFKKINRADFFPEDAKELAELDEAFPIGYGQTISQPLVVAFMMELLQPAPGNKILDIGSGSGWTTALLAYIVSGRSKLETVNFKHRGKGKVMAIEIVPELKEFGEQNTAKYNFVKKGVAQFICADGARSFGKEAPFDRMLCSAAIQGNEREIPRAWMEQLTNGGRIVMPIQSAIWLFIKKGEGQFEKKEYPGFSFVPFVHQ